MVASPVVSPNTASKQAKTLVPPERQFWQHYSPHHEFPWSSVISVAIHGLAIFLIVALFVRLNKEDQEDTPLLMEPVVIAGGGGVESGAGTAKGLAHPNKEAADEGNPDQPATTKPAEQQVDLQKVIDNPLDVPNLNDRNARHITLPTKAIQSFDKLSKDARTQVMEGLAAQGKNGPGTEGGQGDGTGPGEGPHAGAGKETVLNTRQKRTLRWSMTFNTANGEDYLRQLSALKAILAVPVPQGGAYWVYDLSKGRHHRAKKTNLAYLKRIFWIDKTPKSVGNLAAALGLSPQPPWIAAFFPESLEKKLLQEELSAARAKTGRSNIREDDIEETQFEITDKFQPVVVHQRIKGK